MMIPLLTMTPSKIRKPVSVLAFNKLLPVIANPNKAPVAAKGTENPKTKGAESDSKTEARMIKISSTAAPINGLKSLS